MTQRSFFIRFFLIVFCISLFLPTATPAENVPHGVGGIALGTHVDSYPDIIRSNFMKEVVVTDWHGFRKGVISYGTCRHDGLILKMDMKYVDSSREFYDTLLAKYREKFGQPHSYSGDSFGVLLIWKWHFVDSEQNKVSLALQHNGKSSKENIGNMVKLTFPEKIEEERLCFIEMCAQHKEDTDENRLKELSETDWSYLIPQ
ncbi:MAG: hypothetical protein VR65_14810 [Desulfobulbaceae bacterium BRH_c16a]|nr:MAG: hypothetical protein VR65_14810 [Desulfobulbaceae bacterium BRH_c16a]